MADALRILMLEDNPADAELLERELRKGGLVFTLRRVETGEAFAAALKEFAPDVVLADYKLPAFDAPAALEIVKRAAPSVPVIVVSGTVGEETAVAMLQQGAVDYVLKDRPHRLPSAVNRAIAMRDEKTRIAATDRRYRTIIDTTQDGFWYVDAEGRFLDVNAAACGLLGYTREEMLRMRIADVEAVERQADVEVHIAKMRRTGGDRFETRHRRKDGSIVDVEVTTSFIREASGAERVFVFIRDIAERRRSEKSLAESEARFKELFRYMSSAVAIYTTVGEGNDFIFKDCNEALLRIEKVRRKDVIGKNVAKAFPAVKKFGLFEVFRRVYRTGRSERFPMKYYQDPHVAGWRENFVYKLPSDEVVAIYDDVTARKQAEEALEDMKRFPEENPNPVLRIAASGEILLANPAAGKVLAAWHTAVGKKAPRRWRKLVACRLASRKTCPDGEQEEEIKGRAFSFVIAPVKERYYANLYGRDITESKKAAESLAESETRFRRFSEASGYGFAMGRLDGQLLFGNAATLRIVGEKREEDFTAHTFYHYYASADRKILREKILPIVIRKGQWSGDIPLRTVKGKTIETNQNIFLITDETGKPIMVGNIITDITARRRLEMERDRLFNYSVDMLCVAGFDGYFRQVNPAWERTLGWPRAELMAKPFISFVHPDDRKHMGSALEELSRGNAVLRLENRFRCKDGSYRWLSWNSFPLVAEEQTFAVARDMTDAKRFEETKEAFIRNISHELKTPIGMSKMAFDLFDAAMKKWNMRQLKKSREILEKNIRRLDKDVGQILDLFALKKAVPKKGRPRCSLRRIAGDVRRSLVFLMEHKGISFRVRVGRDANRAAIRHADLRTVVYNLVDNAIKFTEKGSITLAARRVRDRVRITVTDTGMGIAEKDRSELFGKFFKGHPSIAGSGLGLVICRDIVTSYGGTIAVESKGAGRGTSVIVTLPVAGRGSRVAGRGARGAGRVKE